MPTYVSIGCFWFYLLFVLGVSIETKHWLECNLQCQQIKSCSSLDNIYKYKFIHCLKTDVRINKTICFFIILSMCSWFICVFIYLKHKTYVYVYILVCVLCAFPQLAYCVDTTFPRRSRQPNCDRV